MWSFGRRDEISPTNHQQHHLVMTKKVASPKTKKQPRRKTRNSDGPSLYLIEENMNVNETKQGIEVSLDFCGVSSSYSPLNVNQQVLACASPPNGMKESRDPESSSQQALREPVISIPQLIRQRQRVHRTQFSVAISAMPSPENASNPTASSLQAWRPRDHRIPLRGKTALYGSYEDVLNLLQHCPVTDEFSSVHHELEQLTQEIEALEKDRDYLQQNLNTVSTIYEVPNCLSFNISPTSAGKPVSSFNDVSSTVSGGHLDWDVGKLLDSALLTDDERIRLQRKRGNCLTLQFGNPRAKDVFLAKCGAKSPLNSNNKRRAPGDVIMLGPHNCKPGGSASSIRHLCLMSNNRDSHIGFFISKDTGKSQTWGRIPPKLFRRIQENGGKNEIGDLVYLSTGPGGCYYAEFRSGECWWGSPVEDDDFHSIIQAWDVYRVVFGPIHTMEDERGNTRLNKSWIILGRDGRVAWKNLPSRLHNRLESRLGDWPAPAEVSLGAGDSYFIRYLDGTIDYCLPAQIAQVCEYIERNGGSITDIMLHPEITRDFLIRHTELR